MCPEGLNGGLEPVQLSVPQLPMWDMNTLVWPVCKSSQLQVDLPQATLSDKSPFFPGPCKASMLPSSPHPAVKSPSKAVNCTSMATEFQELLSQTLLDTSGPASEDTTLRRPISVAQVMPWTIGEEDPLRLPADITTSSQAWWDHTNQPFTLFNPGIRNSWGDQCPCCPATQDSSWDRPEHPLQWDTSTTRGDERAMECLLTTRASMDAHQRKQVSDFKTAFF